MGLNRARCANGNRSNLFHCPRCICSRCKLKSRPTQGFPHPSAHPASTSTWETLTIDDNCPAKAVFIQNTCRSWNLWVTSHVQSSDIVRWAIHVFLSSSILQTCATVSQSHSWISTQWRPLCSVGGMEQLIGRAAWPKPMWYLAYLVYLRFLPKKLRHVCHSIIFYWVFMSFPYLWHPCRIP